MNRPRFPRGVRLGDDGEDWLDAAVLSGWRPNLEAWPVLAGRRTESHPLHVVFSRGELLVQADELVLGALFPSDRPDYEVAGWDKVPRDGWTERHREEAFRRLMDRRQDLVEPSEKPLSRDACRVRVENRLGEEAARRERHYRAWSGLRDLPQLFIAV